MATPIAVGESPVGDHGRMLDHRAVDCSYDYCTDELNDCKTYCWGGARSWGGAPPGRVFCILVGCVPSYRECLLLYFTPCSVCRVCRGSVCQ